LKSVPHSVEEELKLAARRVKGTVAGLAASLLLLVPLYLFEDAIVSSLAVFIGKAIAEAVYFSLLGLTSLSASFYTYKACTTLTSLLMDRLSEKPSLKPAVPLLSMVSKVLALALALTVALWLLSVRISFLYDLVQGMLASLSELASTLIALVLALQVKEIVGNYIAGLIIKASGLVDEGEFLRLSGEYVRVEKINYAYTRLVNRFGEEICVPNLRFLLESFRKPYSRGSGRYVELRFSLPYSYSPDEVRKRVKQLLERYNRTYSSPRVRSYRLLVLDLASYSVIYELQVKPSRPVFPESLKSDMRQLLLEEFGEDLATPTIISLPGWSESASGPRPGQTR